MKKSNRLFQFPLSSFSSLLKSGESSTAVRLELLRKKYKNFLILFDVKYLSPHLLLVERLTKQDFLIDFQVGSQLLAPHRDFDEVLHEVASQVVHFHRPRRTPHQRLSVGLQTTTG